MLADPEADDGISHGTGYAMSETVTPVSSLGLAAFVHAAMKRDLLEPYPLQVRGGRPVIPLCDRCNREIAPNSRHGGSPQRL